MGIFNIFKKKNKGVEDLNIEDYQPSEGYNSSFEGEDQLPMDGVQDSVAMTESSIEKFTSQEGLLEETSSSIEGLTNTTVPDLTEVNSEVSSIAEVQKEKPKGIAISVTAIKSKKNFKLKNNVVESKGDSPAIAVEETVEPTIKSGEINSNDSLETTEKVSSENLLVQEKFVQTTESTEDLVVQAVQKGSMVVEPDYLYVPALNVQNIEVEPTVALEEVEVRVVSDGSKEEVFLECKTDKEDIVNLETSPKKEEIKETSLFKGDLFASIRDLTMNAFEQQYLHQKYECFELEPNHPFSKIIVHRYFDHIILQKENCLSTALSVWFKEDSEEISLLTDKEVFELDGVFYSRLGDFKEEEEQAHLYLAECFEEELEYQHMFLNGILYLNQVA